MSKGKIVVLVDATGRVVGAGGASDAEGTTAGIAALPGQTLHEVEVSEEFPAMSAVKKQAWLRRLILPTPRSELEGRRGRNR